MVVRVEIKNQLRISIIFQILREKFSIFEINFPFKIENSINFEVTKMREKNRNSKIWDDGSLGKTIIRADPYSLSRSTSIRSLHIRWKFSIFHFFGDGFQMEISVLKLGVSWSFNAESWAGCTVLYRTILVWGSTGHLRWFLAKMEN